MATAMINGKPSIYITPVTPVNPTYPARIKDFTEIAESMATEPEPDFDWENDPETVAELNAWYDSLDTPEAFEEYDAWVTEQERIAIESECEMTARGLEAHICSQFACRSR